MKRIVTTMLAVMAIAVAMAAPEGAKPVLSILGDSYSTFYGYIPDGNESWYYDDGRNSNLTDVSDVRQTWWWQLISEGGYILGVNESYSGAPISYTGYQQKDYTERAFITRLGRVVPSDVLLIFGGTNDSWIGGPLGEYENDKLTLGHMFEFRPALDRLLVEAGNRFPGARILFIVNSDLRNEIVESIHRICSKHEVEYIDLKDIAKQNGHPTVEGMRQIKDQVLKRLMQKVDSKKL